MTLATQESILKVCSHCHKGGHIVDQCWTKYPNKRPTKQTKRQKSESAMSTVVTIDQQSADIKTVLLIETAKTIEWVLNSAVSSHICHDHKYFRRLIEISNTYIK